MVLWKTESAEFKEKTRAESGGKKKREGSGRSNPPAPTKNPGCESIRDFSFAKFTALQKSEPGQKKKYGFWRGCKRERNTGTERILKFLQDKWNAKRNLGRMVQGAVVGLVIFVDC
ncbi:hypothetical protein [Fournierella massiliensis]|uniref:hypothetical protein n=1 Tax=Allofournierella massiliensis TaxID=1650663 RepID=UPI0035213F9D